MKHPLDLYRQFKNDQSGVAAVWSTLLAVIIFALTAIAVDGSYIYFNRAELQSTADASALAAASDPANHISIGNAYAEINMPNADHGDVLADADIEDGTWDSATRVFDPDGTPVDAIRVTTRTAAANANALDLFFAPIIGQSTVDLAMTAVATFGPGDGDFSYCFLALSGDEEKAFHLHNNVDLPEACGVAVNSDYCDPGSSGAIYVDNNSTIGGDTQVTGCVHENSPNSEVTGDLTEGAEPTPDPFGDRAQDIKDDIEAHTGGTPGDCDIDAKKNGGNKTLAPGYYKDCVFSGNGTIVLQQGVFYIEGKIVVEGQANVEGLNTTIVLLEETDLDFGNNGIVDLTAPSSGIYEGIAITAHPDINSSKQVVFHNNVEAEITGALYFPNQLVEFENHTHSIGGCMEIISNFILMHNNVDLTQNCYNQGGGGNSTGTATLRLVD